MLIDDAVKNNPIIVLFNYEGIALIEKMAPTLNSENVKCWLLSMYSIYESWMVYVGQETKKCQLILKCWSRNWEDSSYFELFDIWKVIYIDLNGTGPQKNFQYIRIFDI